MARGKRKPPAVAAIILAAGGSERMGTPKQLLPIAGQPMVRRVAEAACAAALSEVVVVIGAHADRVSLALAGLPVRTVHNADWHQGLATSLRAGIAALSPQVQAALVVLADQPLVSSALLGQLVDDYSATSAPIVVPVFRGQRGHPVLFDRALFAELSLVQGDEGGKTVIARQVARVHWLDVDEPGVTLDVDTWEDYCRATPGEVAL